jgi:DNA polymerase III alpha subunit
VTSDKFGRILVTDQEAFEALYTQRASTLENVLMLSTNTITRFNNSVKQNADTIPNLQIPDDLSLITLDQFDKDKQANWFMPDTYKNFPLEEFLYRQCSTQAEIDRVSEELNLFDRHGMLNILRYLKYLVDTMRENGILWGVGRGSSVASYCLFLLGVHRIDSILYNLDIHEFLK